MPELPEVETVKNILIKAVLNKTISEVSVYYDKIVRNVDIVSFQTSLTGQTIRDVKRKGKYLIIIFDNYSLLSHLRMEGKYNLMMNEEISKHDHVVFKFSDGTNLRYNDTRKFGTMDLFNTTDLQEVYQSKPLRKLGRDPFESEFDFELVYDKLSKANKPIKSALLDQEIISGLGNIYVDEVLFYSKILPTTKSNTLSREKVEELVLNSRKVLERAIALGGTTVKSFTASHSISGRFQNELAIHTLKNCSVCHTEVTKIKVGGRTSYVCENCQK